MNGGFETSANRVGTTAATTFGDSGLAAGTYVYRVVAQDAAGNASLASTDASATVTATGSLVIGGNSVCRASGSRV